MLGSNKLLLDRLNTMFEDEVKAIQGRHEKPRILYKSRSIKVTVYVRHAPVNFTVPFRRVDEAIDNASSLSDGTGYDQALLDELLHARQLYNDQIEGRNAPRADHTGRRGIVVSMQYAAAWTYFLLSELERCEIRNLFLEPVRKTREVSPAQGREAQAEAAKPRRDRAPPRCGERENAALVSAVRDHDLYGA